MKTVRNKATKTKPMPEIIDSESSHSEESESTPDPLERVIAMRPPPTLIKPGPKELSRGDRGYDGPGSRLMNALYDAMGDTGGDHGSLSLPLNIPSLEGWHRVSLHIARACKALEGQGWRKK